MNTDEYRHKDDSDTCQTLDRRTFNMK